MKVGPKTLEKCAPLKELKGGTDIEVVTWGVGVVLDYTDCADKQEKLAKSYVATQKVQAATEAKRPWYSWFGF